MRILLGFLIILFLSSASIAANDSDPHLILDELLDKTEIMRPGQFVSVYDLEKAEKAAIAKLKMIAKTNPTALIQPNSSGRTIAMRAAHAGLINILATLIDFNVVNLSLSYDKDNRGLSIVDQVVTAPVRTIRVCKNDRVSEHIPGALWDTYATLLRSYENILAAFVNKLPTNPRLVAKTWLKDCPNADRNVRKRMAELSQENSSKKIQEFLLAENKKYEQERIKRKEDTALAMSKPPLDPETEAALQDAEVREVGPFELVDNPNGGGVLIAKINGDRSKLKADTKGKFDVYASVGHRVTHIEYIQLASLKDVDRALTEFREKEFKRLSMTLFVSKSYNRKVISITVPFD